MEVYTNEDHCNEEHYAEEPGPCHAGDRRDALHLRRVKDANMMTKRGLPTVRRPYPTQFVLGRCVRMSLKKNLVRGMQNYGEMLAKIGG